MKLLNNYNKVILEELLAEDRNQAKAILQKAGITDGGWRLKPEHDIPNSKEKNTFDLVKIMAQALEAHKMVGDLGYWTNVLLNDYYGVIPLEGFKLVFDEVLQLSKEVKKTPKDYLDLNGSDDLYGTLLDSANMLEQDWVDKFIEKYVPKDIRRVLHKNFNTDVFRDALITSAESPHDRKKLIKLHRKLSRFMPYDTHGNKRSDEEVLSVVDYIRNIRGTGDYGTEDDIKMVKDSSNVIWEGDGQMVIQITKEDAINDRDTNKKNEKICHGSENWCIINDPSEYWKDNAGESTYVLFNKDLNNPYNRIAIISIIDDFGYWDEDDNEISDKIDIVIPNLEEIKDAIREKGELMYNRDFDTNDKSQELLDSGRILDNEEIEDLSDEHKQVYIKRFILNDDVDYDDIEGKVHLEGDIPTELQDGYYKKVITLMNESGLTNYYDELEIPNKYKEPLIPNVIKYISHIKEDDILGGYSIGLMSDYERQIISDYIIEHVNELNLRSQPIQAIFNPIDRYSSPDSDRKCKFERIFYGEFLDNDSLLLDKYQIDSMKSSLNCQFGIIDKIIRKIGVPYFEKNGHFSFLNSKRAEHYLDDVANDPDRKDIFEVMGNAIKQRFEQNDTNSIRIRDFILEKYLGIKY